MGRPIDGPSTAAPSVASVRSEMCASPRRHWASPADSDRSSPATRTVRCSNNPPDDETNDYGVPLHSGHLRRRNPKFPLPDRH